MKIGDLIKYEIADENDLASFEVGIIMNVEETYHPDSANIITIWNGVEMMPMFKHELEVIS